MPQFDTHEYVKNLGEELMPPPPILGVPSGRGVRPTPAACPAALNAWLYHAIRAMRQGPRRPPLVVVEAALAHTVRNPTEAAYARSDLFERRRDEHPPSPHRGLCPSSPGTDRFRETWQSHR